MQVSNGSSCVPEESDVAPQSQTLSLQVYENFEFRVGRTARFGVKVSRDPARRERHLLFDVVDVGTHT